MLLNHCSDLFAQLAVFTESEAASSIFTHHLFKHQMNERTGGNRIELDPAARTQFKP